MARLYTNVINIQFCAIEPKAVNTACIDYSSNSTGTAVEYSLYFYSYSLAARLESSRALELELI